MKAEIRPHRIRTIALLLTGVLPLAAQPAALAGRIATSRYVDRMVGDQPGKLSMEDLVRLLSESDDSEAESSDAPEAGGDVMAVLIQCKLLSLFSDSALLQATDVDSKPMTLGPVALVRTVSEPEIEVERVVLPVVGEASSHRRLSDEQPLGP